MVGRANSWLNPAPAMAGMPRRKEKRAASAGSNLRQLPAAMVTPDREMPGMSAMAWAIPTTMASGIRPWSRFRAPMARR